MANLHARHQLLAVDDLEEEIKNKVDKEEVGQLKKEIVSMRVGQKQAQKQWKKIEKIIYKQESNKRK